MTVPMLRSLHLARFRSLPSADGRARQSDLPGRRERHRQEQRRRCVRLSGRGHGLTFAGRVRAPAGESRRSDIEALPEGVHPIWR